MRNSLASGWLRLGPVLAFMVLLGACTTTTITPQFVQPAPEQKINTVIVAELSSDVELLGLYIPRLREADVFQEVIVGSLGPIPAVSHWGALALALTVLAAGTLVLRSRRPIA